MLGSMNKCSQDLLSFKISPMALVFLAGRLLLRPGSFRKSTGWDFTRVVTQGWVL